MIGIIYKATNLITGKSYVGLTTKTLAERIHAHINKANIEKSIFQKSIKKHNIDNFNFQVIDSANTKEELINKEIFWIHTENTLYPNGYNLTSGGEGTKGMCNLVKSKISNSKKGVANPKLKGRKISATQRLKISKKLGGGKVIAVNLQTGLTQNFTHVKATSIAGFNPSLVCAVIKGKRLSHKNHLFYYANTELSNNLTVDCQRNAYLVKLSMKEYNLGTSVRAE